jgi:DNA helicase IV|tara:strand:+ start:136 stop:450 length:315 start_codon:yes stop_codon:yes gene_type:complete
MLNTLKNSKNKKYTELLFVYAPSDKAYLTERELKETYPIAWKNINKRFLFDMKNKKYLKDTDFQNKVYKKFKIDKVFRLAFDNHFAFLSEILVKDKKLPIGGVI